TSNNHETCVFYITVPDTEPPKILACPANVSQINDQDRCGAVVIFNDPAFADNCSGATLQQTTGLPSGSFFPIGDTINTFEVVDSAGHHSAPCSFVITVLDTQKPVVT